MFRCWCVGLLSAIDLVEVNPVLGASQEAVEATASLAVDVIASSLGQTREGAHASIDAIPAEKSDTEQLCLWELEKHTYWTFKPCLTIPLFYFLLLFNIWEEQTNLWIHKIKNEIKGLWKKKRKNVTLVLLRKAFNVIYNNWTLRWNYRSSEKQY